jgi:hypothetical protein
LTQPERDETIETPAPPYRAGVSIAEESNHKMQTITDRMDIVERVISADSIAHAFSKYNDEQTNAHHGSFGYATILKREERRHAGQQTVHSMWCLFFWQ